MIKFISSKIIYNKQAKIIVLEKKSLKFKIKRFYYVRNKNLNNIRDGHAHKELQQIFQCLCGKIEINFDDGFTKKKIVLKESDKPLFIDKGIWREIIYIKKHSILSVLCSKEYSEKDYIRNYEQFLKWKKSLNKK